MSMPSTRISPEVGEWKRCNSFVSVDLPEPDGPTMPITSPGAISIDTFFKTSGSSGL